MATAEKCAYCGDEIRSPAVMRGGKAYCCEACAFEGRRPSDCAGRPNSVTAPPVVELDMRTPQEPK
jgi:hypothetical protein